MNKKDLMGLLQYFDKVQKVTHKAMKMIPEDKLDFKPVPEMMSIGELLKHIYVSERVFANGAKKGSITEDDFKKEDKREFKDLKSLLNYAKKVHKETKAVGKSISEKELKRKVKVFWGEELCPSICFGILYDEHWHHRGQLYVYLRLLGIKPPDLYGYK
jgi:uncharacterized damage-inducible protein DinB